MLFAERQISLIVPMILAGLEGKKFVDNCWPSQFCLIDKKAIKLSVFAQAKENSVRGTSHEVCECVFVFVCSVYTGNVSSQLTIIF